MSAESDELLIARFRETGDETAFEEIVRRHHDFLFRLAVRICGNVNDAEDIVQQSLAAIFKKLSHDSAIGSVRSWMGGFVMNHGKMFNRARRRKTRNERNLRQAAASASPAEHHPADAEELHQALRKTVEELPNEYRIPLTLHFYEKMSAVEIGRLMELKERTVHDRVAKALVVLRRRMASRGFSTAEAVLPTMLSAAGALDVLRQAPSHWTRTAAKLKTFSASKSVKVPGIIGRFSGLAALVAGFVAIGGGGLLWFGSWTDLANETSQKIPSSIAPENTDLPEAKREDFFVKWDFNDGQMPNAIQMLKGKCFLTKKGGLNNSGCLAVEDGAMLLISVPKSSLPLIVEGHKQMKLPKPQRGSWSNSLMWANRTEKTVIFINYSEEAKLIKPGEWHKTWIFCGEDFSVGLKPDGEPRDIIVGRRASDSTPLLLAFSGNFNMDDLTVRTAKPEEIPNVEKYLEAVRKLPPEERKGKVILSELRPISGKPWTVEFFDQ